MDYKQFMKLMESGEESGKESISTLQEFVNEFPYFQSAHILLAKSMHEQQHVRFEKQLKIAAVYAGDRKSLFSLIHPNKTKLISKNEVPVDSPFISPSFSGVVESVNIFAEDVNASLIPPFEEEVIIDYSSVNPIEERRPVTFYKEENEIEGTETNDYDEPPVADPHDIIRRRLIEILGLKEDKKEEFIPESPVVESKIESIPVSTENSKISEYQKTDSVIEEIKIPAESRVSKKDAIDQLVEESTKAVDFIQKAEIEYALESTFIQSLEKLPVIENQKGKEKLSSFLEEQSEYSFYDWLKIKTVPGFGNIEEVHAYPIESIQAGAEIEQATEFSESGSLKVLGEEKKYGDIYQLIERFIQSDPKIIPSKTEFYSPASQAKKSITENEDVVSETLAKIYHQQGNLLKARSSYQKLSLLYPEKMAYFATLISELDKATNNLDKQDL